MAQRSVPDLYMKLKRRHADLFAAAEALGQAARRVHWVLVDFRGKADRLTLLFCPEH